MLFYTSRTVVCLPGAHTTYTSDQMPTFMSLASLFVPRTLIIPHAWLQHVIPGPVEIQNGFILSLSSRPTVNSHTALLPNMSADSPSTNPSLSNHVPSHDDEQSSEQTKPRRSYRLRLYSPAYPHYYVLAFQTTLEFLQQWGVDHDLTGNEIETMAAWGAISAKLRPYGCLCGVVRANGIRSLSIVVASNLTREDLARANDLEMIRAVQLVLDTTENPVWGTPIRV
ncbi:hypothetical protein BD779DRAFT_1560504 [Infundibulicybe gibba]|nr:hypothetical protein BD779DRAFT_1560504 [Infundibulicybe gibba]